MTVVWRLQDQIQPSAVVFIITATVVYSLGGMGCTPLLHCRDWLSLPPTVGYSIVKWVWTSGTSNNNKCWQWVWTVGSYMWKKQPKSVNLVWGLAATWHSVSIHQMNQLNSCNGCAHDDSTKNTGTGITNIITNHYMQLMQTWSSHYTWNVTTVLYYMKTTAVSLYQNYCYYNNSDF